MLLLDAMLADREASPALLVLDAWLDTVAMNLNIKDTRQARLALHPWKVLANRHDMAVLLLTHTNRMDTTNTRDLMGGTAALRPGLQSGQSVDSGQSEHKHPAAAHTDPPATDPRHSPVWATSLGMSVQTAYTAQTARTVRAAG